MNDWLEIGDSKSRITTPKLRGENTRGKAVHKKASGRSRSWVSDGQYVWYRPKSANPAIRQRLADQLARGELKHVTTSDDVQIYEVQKTSPFHRPEMDLTRVNLPTVTRRAVIAACKGDWATFLDSLEEVAFRFKNAVYSDGKPADEKFERQLYQEKVSYIFNLIKLRGGPSPQLIDQEVAALRARRKQGSGAGIVLPPERRVQRV